MPASALSLSKGVKFHSTGGDGAENTILGDVVLPYGIVLLICSSSKKNELSC
jgi:hypothetical protein